MAGYRPRSFHRRSVKNLPLPVYDASAFSSHPVNGPPGGIRITSCLSTNRELAKDELPFEDAPPLVET